MIEKGIKLSKLKREIKDAMDKGSSSFFTAFGGLNVNCDFEVLNAENQPIKGLYAASFEASRKISHAYATWTLAMPSSFLAVWAVMPHECG